MEYSPASFSIQKNSCTLRKWFLRQKNRTAGALKCSCGKKERKKERRKNAYRRQTNSSQTKAQDPEITNRGSLSTGNTGYTQKKGAVSKVNKKFISPYTGITYNVSSGNCPSFSCATSSSLLMLTAGPQGQFPRWRRSRKRLSLCSVLRCPDL